MPGEQYYLFLIANTGELFRVYNKPLTLKKMDERTTKYSNKEELIKTILSNCNSKLKYDDIKEIQIMRKPNSKKEEYVKEYGPIYKKDKMVLNEEATLAKLELKSHDSMFVLYLLKSYEKIPNFKNIILEIKGLINNNKNYFDEIYELLTRVTKTYKGCRSIYFKIKSYDERRKIKYIRKNSKLDPTYDSSIDKLSEEEIRAMELMYLKEYDNELLDIDDFIGYGDISPFDGNKKTL